MEINKLFLLDAFDFLDQKVENETINLAIVDPLIIIIKRIEILLNLKQNIEILHLND